MKANILIVDDSIVSTQFFSSILEQDNHNIFTSSSGINIVDTILTNNIDIILLDVVMPDINGYEILRLLQETDSTKDIPVIMITALTSPQEVKKALESGALDFIRKTSESIEVIARVHSALRLKYKQDQLKHNAQRDHLTQLYNRQFFNMAFDRIISEKNNYADGIAFIIIDVDFFKNVNDTYGHTSGDVVLEKVANTISKSVKLTDIVCRYGGEEFCIVCSNTSMAQAYVIAERIRNNVAKIGFDFGNETFFITVSCGVSFTSYNDNKTGLKVINEADSALYNAKRNGRNQTVVF